MSPLPLTLLCVAVDKSKNMHGDIFVLKNVNPEDYIDDLKGRIKIERAPRFDKFAKDELKVYKLMMPLPLNSESAFKRWLAQENVVFPDDEVNHQHFQRLNPTFFISQYFKDQPPQGCLHLVVQFPSIEDNKRKHGGEEEPDASPPGAKRLQKEISKGSPSSMAVPGEFSKIVGPGHAITCNRPFEYNTIPLVLLHEAFGMFKDKCKTVPSERAFKCFQELAPVGCKWHESETIRRSAIQSVLAEHLGLCFHEQKIPGTEFITDGNLIVIVMPAAIRECKNEHGSALFQAILYYANFLRKALEHHRRYINCNTRFPSILMVDMGSYLGFYGAAWDGKRVVVEPLTPIFDLSVHWRDLEARCAIASSLDALMVAVRNIQDHYDAVEAEAKNLVPSEKYDPRVNTARSYPHITSYADNGQEITFTYNARLDEMKLIFSAILNHPNSGHCIVKFTQRYSEATHNYLASRGSAPMLRQCVRVSAGWFAVIMDESKYQVLSGQNLSKADQEKVQHKVKSVAQTLHDEGFVHGDIRDTNLLIALESLASDDVAVHFIDFDWAGRIGEARYPVGINTETVKRPDGAKSGELITKEHDEDMISYLFE